MTSELGIRILARLCHNLLSDGPGVFFRSVASTPLMLVIQPVYSHTNPGMAQYPATPSTILDLWTVENQDSQLRITGVDRMLPPSASTLRPVPIEIHRPQASAGPFARVRSTTQNPVSGWRRLCLPLSRYTRPGITFDSCSNGISMRTVMVSQGAATPD